MKKLFTTVFKPIFECIGIALLSLLGVNIISFLLKVLKDGWGENPTVSYKHGVFHLNEQAAGLIWGDGKTNGFLLLILLASILLYYKKGKFPFLERPTSIG